jgi:hypothetical protein
MFETSVQEDPRIGLWSILGGVAMFVLLTAGGYFMVVGF